MNEFIKNTITTFEPHLYELDQSKLSNLEILGKKKFHREYNVIQRKIIFCTKFDKSYNLSYSKKSSEDSYFDLEKNYYSNYKFFRDFLSSNFESKEIKNELFNIKSILDNSKKLREEIEKFINKNSNEDVDFFLEKGAKEENIIKKTKFNNNVDTNFNQSNNLLKSSNKNEINKQNKILQNFKLFKIKDDQGDTHQEDFFRFYSELDNPVDTNAIIQNDNISNNKFLNFHKKLLKFYYTEQFFTEFASEYNKNSKGTQSIAPEIRMRMPVEFIDNIFKPRGKDAYANLDAFMVKYDREHKASLREKDLLENIYGILSKCDNSNFLSFLYSKNDDFKYIYDNFAKSNTNKSLEVLELSGISNESEMKGESSNYF